jgi:uncharacterized RDD family membrane protein YckC
MNEIEKYIHKVMQQISATPSERQRIEADLRTHLQEALAAGNSPEVVLNRMGNPIEVAEEFMSQVSLTYASFWKRLVAFIVDMMIIIFITFALAIPGIVMSNLVPQHPSGFEWFWGGLLVIGAVACTLAIIGVILLYFPLMEARFGQTVGKRLFRLRVLKENGLPVGYKEAFLRRLSFYFEFFALDALFVFFTAKRQRALDIVARTIVIQD